MIHKIFAQKKTALFQVNYSAIELPRISAGYLKIPILRIILPKLLYFSQNWHTIQLKNSLTLILYLLFGIYKGFDYWARQPVVFYALFSQTGLLTILLAVYVYHNHLRNNLYQICRNHNLQTENSCYFILLLL